MKTYHENILVAGAGHHFIGCHLPGLAELHQGHIQILSRDPDRVKQHLDESLAGQTLFTRTDRSFGSAIRDSEIDTAYILTPHSEGMHLNRMREAILAKRDVFVEKPLITETGEIEELVELLRFAVDENLIVTTCHPRRFDPPTKGIKESIERLEECFGTLKAIHLKTKGIDSGRQGSLLLDLLPHGLDLVQYIFETNQLKGSRIHDSRESYLVEGEIIDGPAFSISGELTKDERSQTLVLDFAENSLAINLSTGAGTLARSTSEEMPQFAPSDYNGRNRALQERIVRGFQRVEEPYLSPLDLVSTAILTVSAAQGTFDHGTLPKTFPESWQSI